MHNKIFLLVAFAAVCSAGRLIGARPLRYNTGGCSGGGGGGGGNKCHTYTYSTDKLNWNDAEAACVAAGGHLASVHNEEVEAELQTLVNQNDAWIGLHDPSLTEAGFEWSDGSCVNYESWAPGEPNEMGSEDCVHIAWSWSLGGGWNDQSCAHLFNYICQFTAECPTEECELEVTDHTSSAHACNYNYHQDPIEISSADGTSVTFSVSQYWKHGESISWLAVDYTDAGGNHLCPKTQEPASGYVDKYTAACTDGVAQVTLYIHDGKFAQLSGVDLTDDIPARCHASDDEGKKCQLDFELQCSCTSTAKMEAKSKTVPKGKMAEGGAPRGVGVAKMEAESETENTSVVAYVVVGVPVAAVALIAFATFRARRASPVSMEI